jgi:uncharacterized protein YlaI
MSNLTAEERRWQHAVHSLEYCVLCDKHGVQWAHRNEGKGMGMKTHPSCTAALCPECHRRIDQGNDMTREERRSTMDRAIVLTHMRLAMQGLIQVKAK